MLIARHSWQKAHDVITECLAFVSVSLSSVITSLSSV